MVIKGLQFDCRRLYGHVFKGKCYWSNGSLIEKVNVQMWKKRRQKGGPWKRVMAVKVALSNITGKWSDRCCETSDIKVTISVWKLPWQRLRRLVIVVGCWAPKIDVLPVTRKSGEDGGRCRHIFHSDDFVRRWDVNEPCVVPRCCGTNNAPSRH